ncbi:type II toxin-antitoxin system VapC family toxin [Mesorhizobium sp. WSM4904]|uniref:type II toxin-antitoxin system VapC family toxin n=1 Tax=Mesorhizobium sp. WSM4904 TaxID=3038545 RepID=UPI00241871D1|nr:type II toxin-antitoxin system VapC family toxin [Mesorhizobium sp. WSM4904]WFP64405.1 type II toxin-antitoxin system VapC family toxin [Mesorhizobium sp. WSM4904]
MIVVDASVFVKLFKQEDDSEAARSLVDHMLEQGQGFLAPSVVLYEALSAALHVELPLTVIGQLFDQFRELGLVIEEPTTQDLATAEKIATSAAPGNGYPTLFDSIYHAMALERGGTFVTADQRHVAKAAQFGSVVLLADWRAG